MARGRIQHQAERSERDGRRRAMSENPGSAPATKHDIAVLAAEMGRGLQAVVECFMRAEIPIRGELLNKTDEIEELVGRLNAYALSLVDELGE
jgi:hypothetical protein